MGDRAVLTFDRELKGSSIGVYVHWHGDPKSVEEILATVRPHGRLPADDPSYAMARLIEAACIVAGERQPTGVGVGVLRELDCENGDNGVYVIGGAWSVVEHYRNGRKPKVAA